MKKNGLIILVNFPDGITADFSGAKLPQSEFKGDLDNVVFGCSEFWCSDFSNKSMKRSWKRPGLTQGVF